jgi:hypothetical protein
MTYDQDYTTNRTLKTVISYVSTDSWLNDDVYNIELAGLSMHQQDREAMSGKTRGGVVYLFVSYSSWGPVKLRQFMKF